MAAFIPFFSNPSFRYVFNKTIDTVPATVIFMSAGMFVIAAGLNFFLFSKREKFVANAVDVARRNKVEQSEDATRNKVEQSEESEKTVEDQVKNKPDEAKSTNLTREVSAETRLDFPT